MNSLWVLQPKIGIGPVIIGNKWSERYYKPLGFFRVSVSQENKAVNEEYEELSGNISVSIEDGIVTSVDARKVCLFKGFNLIGLDVANFEKIINQKVSSIEGPIEYENGDLQLFRNYDELEIYTIIEDGVVVCLACFGN